MFKDLIYSIKQAVKQSVRNKGMSVASIFSITAMLLILAVVLSLTININYITETVKTQFDTVEVFLLDETTDQQINLLKSQIEKKEGVASVELISKDKAMEEFKVRWGDSAYLLDSLSENPLPNSLRVKLSALEYGTSVKAYCSKLVGVEDIRFYADEVNKVINVANAIQKGALVIILFLVVVSVVVVSNTIKITVLARREEIEIMQYVGATNWFIRGPLLLEGVFIGIISAALALGISALAYYEFHDMFSLQAVALFSSGFVDPIFVIKNFAAIFVALGVSIGAFGSIVSMRKFLKA